MSILKSSIFLSTHGPRRVKADGDSVTGLGRILELVIESALQGSNITQYDLALALYGRQDNEALQNVRVRVRKVRQKLSTYYAEGPGRVAPIIITLATGTYMPAFSCRIGVSDADEPPTRLDVSTLTGNLGTEVFCDVVAGRQPHCVLLEWGR